MQTRAMLIVGLIVASAMAVGCEAWDPFDTEPETAAVSAPPSEDQAEPAPMDPRDAELAQRNKDLADLNAAYAELSEEHRQLGEKAQEQEWINDQLLENIRDLKETVDQRDQLFIEVEQLMVENARLGVKNKRLESELTVYEEQLETMRQLRDRPPEETAEPDATVPDAESE
jgi:predicted RNase H-like nuclease (RuvC/YqgF family)